MKKSMISLLLALCLLVGLLPGTALANQSKIQLQPEWFRSEFTFYEYTGEEIKPNIIGFIPDNGNNIATDSNLATGTNLVKDTDFTVTYSNNVDIGTATAIINGMDKYEGTVEISFNIREFFVHTVSVPVYNEDNAVRNIDLDETLSGILFGKTENDPIKYLVATPYSFNAEGQQGLPSVGIKSVALSGKTLTVTSNGNATAETNDYVTVLANNEKYYFILYVGIIYSTRDTIKIANIVGSKLQKTVLTYGENWTFDKDSAFLFYDDKDNLIDQSKTEYLINNTILADKNNIAVNISMTLTKSNNTGSIEIDPFAECLAPGEYHLSAILSFQMKDNESKYERYQDMVFFDFIVLPKEALVEPTDITIKTGDPLPTTVNFVSDDVVDVDKAKYATVGTAKIKQIFDSHGNVATNTNLPGTYTAEIDLSSVKYADGFEDLYIPLNYATSTNLIINQKSTGGGGGTGSGSGGGETGSGTNKPSNEPIKAETKLDASGAAKATLDSKTITDAVSGAKASGSDSIVIAPVVSGDAKEVKVEIPKVSVSEVANGTSAALVVETDKGSLELPNDTLGEITAQAGGASVEIAIAEKSVEDAGVKEAIADKIGDDVATDNAAVAEITVSSGDEKITSFGGKTINAKVSVDGKRGFIEGRKYLALVISSNGKRELLAGKCVADASGKLSVGVKVKHLSTFVVLDKELQSFADADAHWAAEAVDYAVANGLMNGVSDAAFAPNSTLNRAMLVTILYRLAGSPAVAEAAKFVDVAAGEWYTDAVAWAAASGIVTGKTETSFAPMENITREQFATMLMRYCKFAGIDTASSANLGSFSDSAAISAYAKDALAWANASGIITGRTATTIAPTGSATRGEAATMLMRFMQM